jgi:hypothetical protein
MILVLEGAGKAPMPSWRAVKLPASDSEILVLPAKTGSLFLGLKRHFGSLFGGATMAFRASFWGAIMAIIDFPFRGVLGPLCRPGSLPKWLETARNPRRTRPQEACSTA